MGLCPEINKYLNVKVKEQVCGAVSRTVITHLAFSQCYRETGQEKCRERSNTASNLGSIFENGLLLCSIKIHCSYRNGCN